MTAIVVHDLFGGEILRTGLPAGIHYYNRIDGRIVDLTDGQFAAPIEYQDLPAARAVAFEGATANEYDALREALLRHLASGFNTAAEHE